LIRRRRDKRNFNGGVEKKWEGVILKSLVLGLTMRGSLKKKKRFDNERDGVLMEEKYKIKKKVKCKFMCMGVLKLCRDINI
jgi:hypothetical protein